MTWKKRWGYEAKATKTPGVMLMKDGRYLVHAKMGRKRRLVRVIEAPSVREAARARLAILAAAQAQKPGSKPLFAEYAQSLFARKVAQGDIKSAKTRERWDDTLTHHLVPAFGRFGVDEVTKLEVESWKTRVAKRIGSGKLSPRTANGWLSILRGILRSAVDDYDLPRDPTLRVRDFKTDEQPTYTEENPNALTREQTARFLVAMRRLFP